MPCLFDGLSNYPKSPRFIGGEDVNGDISEDLPAHNLDYELSKIQCFWLGFRLMGIILTNSICWARFDVNPTGHYLRERTR